MSGYLRRNMGGWHLRVVTDRDAAYDYLRLAWPQLPGSFFRWLRDGSPGSTYLLTACVSDPERWVHREEPGLIVSEPVVVNCELVTARRSDSTTGDERG